MKVGLGVVLAVLAGAPLAAEDRRRSPCEGRVIDAQTGEPIAKALVSIRNRKVEAVTDAGGRFVLTGVPPGEVEIAVTTVGYGARREGRSTSGRSRRAGDPPEPGSAPARGGGRGHHRARSSRRTPRRPPRTCWAAPSSRTWPTSWSTIRCVPCSPCPESRPATTSAPPSPRGAWASRTWASTWTAS